MSGPPYPLYPPGTGPGQNAIGSFIIGVSPIGDIIPFSYWSTIVSQYANSPILTTLIGNFQQYVDQTMNFDALFDNIWNINSAVGYGLDVWGRIVGLSGRVLQLSGAGSYFGFEESSPSGQTFGQAPFYSGGTITTNFALADSAFRTLIFAKALANICNGSIPAINQILLSLFPGRGNCFCTDGLNMTMTYTFNFALSSVEAAIVSQTGVLPKSVGVSSSVVQNF
jgi:hypothetical protein